MAKQYKYLAAADLRGKRVLLRAGFDVPIADGKVTDDTRIRAIIPTMRYILDHGGSLVIMAHQGRPKGISDPAFSQKPLAPVLELLLKCPVQFADDCTGQDAQEKANKLQPGEVLLLENLRFHQEEKKNDPEFAKKLASLGDVYVQDAFSNCHREHASMIGIPQILPAYMGLQLQKELSHLDKILHETLKPLTLILGGAKLETKIPILEQFLKIGDTILLGGAIANTFLIAKGLSIGRSKWDELGRERAEVFLKRSATDGNATIQLPIDGILSDTTEGSGREDGIEHVKDNEAIFDIGRNTAAAFIERIKRSKMIIWNGPVGYFEQPQFAIGSKIIAEAIIHATKNGAMSVIGGGDTIDVHTRYNIPLHEYTFVSMGGGAMLEYLSGKELKSLTLLLA